MKNFFVVIVLIVMAFTAVAIGKTTNEPQTMVDYILPVIEMEAYSENIMDGAGLPLCFKNAKDIYIRIPCKYIKSDNIYDEPFTESEKPWWL